MTFRQVLLPLVNSHRTTEVAAIARAVAVAKQLGAAITMMAFDPDDAVRGALYTRSFHAEGLGIETTRQHDRHAGTATRVRLFEAAADAAAVRHSQVLRRCLPDEVPGEVANCARTHDVTLVPVRPLDDASDRIVEALIFTSGRPILLFPEPSADRLPGSFGHVAIAWDNSAQSARAVADAMPLLQKARMVSIFTAADKNTAAEIDSGSAMVGYLGSRGVKATFEMIRKDGQSIGKLLEAFALQNRADLLVMGAYRHSRLQEMILGGATRTLIEQPPCWVLMSH